MPTCTQRVKKRQREEAGETARQRGPMRGMSSMVCGERAETCLPRSAEGEGEGGEAEGEGEGEEQGPGERERERVREGEREGQ